jgi:dienelactone hydrolase
MKYPATAILCCCVWLGALGAAPPSFTYDAFAPLEYQVDGTSTGTGVQTDRVSFRAGSTLIHALLVSPDTPAPSMPGVLFVHWLGDPASSDAREFLPDAEWLARRGVVSLLPDEPWSRPNWFEKIRSTATDATDSIATVVALRRCFDVLEKAAGVDPKRLAYVGHDFGATYGALVAEADPRPAWFVFMTPTVSLADWFLLDTERPPADRAAYLAQMSAFDIKAALARASFSGSLTQFASHDEYVSGGKAREFARALPPVDRTVRTYDTTHALDLDAATDDRRSWLGKRLGVKAL